MMTLSDCLRRAWLGLMTAALLAAPARAQVLDPTFGPLDSRAASPHSKGTAVTALATDATGRVLVGGAFDLLDGQVRGKLGRLLPSGQPDASFDPAGVGANGRVTAILPLASGQTLIGGTFTRYDEQPAGRVARLNADGTLDATFNAGELGADAEVLSLAVDGQGRVLVGGGFRRFNGQPAVGLVRLSAAGVPDPGFSFATGADLNLVHTIAPDSAGTLLVGGYRYFANSAGSPFDGMLYRLLPSGAIDSTFTSPLTREDIVFRVAVLPTGKLLIAGSLYTDTISFDSHGIRRLHADGTPDSTFTSLAPNGYVRDLVVLPNQQLLVAGDNNLGSGGSPGWDVCRLLADGTPDPAFTYALPSYYSSAYAVAAGPARSVLVGGILRDGNGQPMGGLARVNATGGADATFTAPTFAEYATLTALARQSTDHVLAIGNFGTISGTVPRRVVRFTPGGALDPAFQLDPAVAATSVEVPAVRVGANDRVYVNAEAHVYRLQPTGARDASFDDGAGARRPSGAGQLRGMREQPDGRVLVWGNFTRYHGHPSPGVVRLTATGAVDPTFTSPVDSTQTFSWVLGVELLPDNSMLIVGTFGTWWLEATGVPRASFNGGQPLPRLTVLALPDTTILVSGAFTLNGTAYQGTYKLTAAGTVDPGFALAPGMAGWVQLVQPDGTLLFREADIGGGPRLRRLLPTGALDPSFAPVEIGTGYFSESAQAYVFQSTGDLVIGGGFTTVNGTQRPSLARLTNIPLGLTADASVARGFDIFPNPAHATLTLHHPTAKPATATLLDVLGRPVRRWTLTTAETRLPLTGIIPGTYAVRVTTAAGGAATRRVVVE